MNYKYIILLLAVAVHHSYLAMNDQKKILQEAHNKFKENYPAFNGVIAQYAIVPNDFVPEDVVTTYGLGWISQKNTDGTARLKVDVKLTLSAETAQYIVANGVAHHIINNPSKYLEKISPTLKKEYDQKVVALNMHENNYHYYGRWSPRILILGTVLAVGSLYGYLKESEEYTFVLGLGIVGVLSMIIGGLYYPWQCKNAQWGAQETYFSKDRCVIDQALQILAPPPTRKNIRFAGGTADQQKWATIAHGYYCQETHGLKHYWTPSPDTIVNMQILNEQKINYLQKKLLL